MIQGPAAPDSARSALVKRGQLLSRATLAYNILEGVVSIAAGVMAGSISLLGFGFDSMIEVSSSLAAIWRLGADADPVHRGRAEDRALRFIGVSFLAVASFVLVDSAHALIARDPPHRSLLGIVITALSVVIMPLLARAKRRVAIALGSRALVADANQTSLCMWLSAVALAGLALNALLGWWRADPVAAICMTPIIANEGFDGLRGEKCCNHD